MDSIHPTGGPSHGSGDNQLDQSSESIANFGIPHFSGMKNAQRESVSQNLPDQKEAAQKGQQILSHSKRNTNTNVPYPTQSTRQRLTQNSGFTEPEMADEPPFRYISMPRATMSYARHCSYQPSPYTSTHSAQSHSHGRNVRDSLHHQSRVISRPGDSIRTPEHPYAFMPPPHYMRRSTENIQYGRRSNESTMPYPSRPQSEFSQSSSENDPIDLDDADITQRRARNPNLSGYSQLSSKSQSRDRNYPYSDLTKAQGSSASMNVCKNDDVAPREHERQNRPKPSRAATETKETDDEHLENLYQNASRAYPLPTYHIALSAQPTALATVSSNLPISNPKNLNHASSTTTATNKDDQHIQNVSQNPQKTSKATTKQKGKLLAKPFKEKQAELVRQKKAAAKIREKEYQEKMKKEGILDIDAKISDERIKAHAEKDELRRREKEIAKKYKEAQAVEISMLREEAEEKKHILAQLAKDAKQPQLQARLKEIEAAEAQRTEELRKNAQKLLEESKREREAKIAEAEAQEQATLQKQQEGRDKLKKNLESKKEVASGLKSAKKKSAVVDKTLSKAKTAYLSTSDANGTTETSEDVYMGGLFNADDEDAADIMAETAAHNQATGSRKDELQSTKITETEVQLEGRDSQDTDYSRIPPPANTQTGGLFVDDADFPDDPPLPPLSQLSSNDPDPQNQSSQTFNTGSTKKPAARSKSSARGRAASGSRARSPSPERPVNLEVIVNRSRRGWKGARKAEQETAIINSVVADVANKLAADHKARDDEAKRARADNRQMMQLMKEQQTALIQQAVQAEREKAAAEAALQAQKAEREKKEAVEAALARVRRENQEQRVYRAFTFEDDPLDIPSTSSRVSLSSKWYRDNSLQPPPKVGEGKQTEGTKRKRAESARKVEKREKTEARAIERMEMKWADLKEAEGITEEEAKAGCDEEIAQWKKRTTERHKREDEEQSKFENRSSDPLLEDENCRPNKQRKTDGHASSFENPADSGIITEPEMLDSTGKVKNYTSYDFSALQALQSQSSSSTGSILAQLRLYHSNSSYSKAACTTMRVSNSDSEDESDSDEDITDNTNAHSAQRLNEQPSNDIFSLPARTSPEPRPISASHNRHNRRVHFADSLVMTPSTFHNTHSPKPPKGIPESDYIKIYSVERRERIDYEWSEAIVLENFLSKDDANHFAENELRKVRWGPVEDMPRLCASFTDEGFFYGIADIAGGDRKEEVIVEPRWVYKAQLLKRCEKRELKSLKSSIPPNIPSKTFIVMKNVEKTIQLLADHVKSTEPIERPAKEAVRQDSVDTFEDENAHPGEENSNADSDDDLEAELEAQFATDTKMDTSLAQKTHKQLLVSDEDGMFGENVSAAPEATSVAVTQKSPAEPIHVTTTRTETTVISTWTNCALANKSAAKCFLELVKPRSRNIDAILKHKNEIIPQINEFMDRLDGTDDTFDASADMEGDLYRIWVEEKTLNGPLN